MIKDCFRCGAVFITNKSSFERRKFCSFRCRQKALCENLEYMKNMKEKLTGKKIHSEAFKDAARKRWIDNNPMKLSPRIGELHPLWMGEMVSYRSLHNWVVRHRGQPKTCESCGVDGLTGHTIHWANISREYKRTLSDWVRLCASCHKAYDRNELALQLA